MAHYATDTILLGHSGEVLRGQKVPSTYLNSLGEEEKVDFDRLEELGLLSSKPIAEEVEEAPDDVTEPAPPAKLEDLNVKQLRALAKERAVKLPPKAKRDQLVKAIQDAETEREAAGDAGE